MATYVAHPPSVDQHGTTRLCVFIAPPQLVLCAHSLLYLPIQSGLPSARLDSSPFRCTSVWRSNCVCWHWEEQREVCLRKSWSQTSDRNSSRTGWLSCVHWHRGGGSFLTMKGCFSWWRSWYQKLLRQTADHCCRICQFYETVKDVWADVCWQDEPPEN